MNAVVDDMSKQFNEFKDWAQAELKKANADLASAEAVNVVLLEELKAFRNVDISGIQKELANMIALNKELSSRPVTESAGWIFYPYTTSPDDIHEINGIADITSIKTETILKPMLKEFEVEVLSDMYLDMLSEDLLGVFKGNHVSEDVLRLNGTMSRIAELNGFSNAKVELGFRLIHNEKV